MMPARGVLRISPTEVHAPSMDVALVEVYLLGQSLGAALSRRSAMTPR